MRIIKVNVIHRFNANFIYILRPFSTIYTYVLIKLSFFAWVNHSLDRFNHRRWTRVTVARVILVPLRRVLCLQCCRLARAKIRRVGAHLFFVVSARRGRSLWHYFPRVGGTPGIARIVDLYRTGFRTQSDQLHKRPKANSLNLPYM